MRGPLVAIAEVAIPPIRRTLKETWIEWPHDTIPRSADDEWRSVHTAPSRSEVFPAQPDARAAKATHRFFEGPGDFGIGGGSGAGSM